MGNTSSHSAVGTHTLSNSQAETTSFVVPTPRTISVSPLDPSTFVSITKPGSSSYGPSPTRTGEYCSWNWEQDTSSCSSWTYTVPVPTPFPVPTPTGAYETAESSWTLPSYTCTDFPCIASVASDYGFEFCLPKSSTESSFSKETFVPPKSPIPTLTITLPTIVPICDPVLSPEHCSSTTSEPSSSTTDSLPTNTFPVASVSLSRDVVSTEAWDSVSLLKTSISDCDKSSTTAHLGPSTEACEFGDECNTSIEFSISATVLVPSAVPTKNSFSYHGVDTRRPSISAASDCDFWSDDCTPTVTGSPTSLDWDPIPLSEHTIAVTLPPRHTDDVQK